jgi:hypothetical protein
MKKRFRLGALVLAVMLVFIYLLAETITVKVKTTSVRRDPKFYAASLATIQAGTALQKLAVKNGWFQVKTKDGVTGWVHSSAIDTRKFNLTALDGSPNTQASSGEVALAAKGFNKRVEDSYRAKNGAANYAGVDKMEKITVLAAEIEEFLKQGKLGEFGGGR